MYHSTFSLVCWASPSRVLDNLKLAGCPKGIEDKKYDRNSFIFNFVFVFDADVDVAPYEPVIRKLGAVLRDCEVI